MDNESLNRIWIGEDVPGYISDGPHVGTYDVPYIQERIKPISWCGWTGAGPLGVRYSLSENVYTEKIVVLRNGSFVGEFINEDAAKDAASSDLIEYVLSAFR